MLKIQLFRGPNTEKSSWKVKMSEEKSNQSYSKYETDRSTVWK